MSLQATLTAHAGTIAAQLGRDGLPPSEVDAYAIVDRWCIEIRATHLEALPLPPAPAQAQAPALPLERLPQIQRNALAAAVQAAAELTVAELADKAGYRFNSNFYAAVAALVRRGLLSRPRPGFTAVTSAGEKWIASQR